jgi:hypothetical protein
MYLFASLRSVLTTEMLWCRGGEDPPSFRDLQGSPARAVDARKLGKTRRSSTSQLTASLPFARLTKSKYHMYSRRMTKSNPCFKPNRCALLSLLTIVHNRSQSFDHRLFDVPASRSEVGCCACRVCVLCCVCSWPGEWVACCLLRCLSLSCCGWGAACLLPPGRWAALCGAAPLLLLAARFHLSILTPEYYSPDSIHSATPLLTQTEPPCSPLEPTAPCALVESRVRA